MLQMPQGETLTKEIAEALPIYCYVDKHTRQVLLQKGVAISEKMRLEIIDVRYMGEAGGIMCIVSHPEGDGKIVMSATNFCFTDKGLIYDKINEYKKARIKWLQQEEMKDRMFGLNERVKSFSTYSNTKTINSLEKISRNDPCPCGSGKKYKHCCSK